MPAPDVEVLDQNDFYERLAQRGYRYSGLFRSLRGIGTHPARPDVVYAEVALPAGTDITGYGIHPALLDAALHPMASVLDRTSEADSVRAASVRVQRDHPVCHRGHPAARPPDPHRQGHLRAARHRPHRRTGDHHPSDDLA